MSARPDSTVHAAPPAAPWQANAATAPATSPAAGPGQKPGWLASVQQRWHARHAPAATHRMTHRNVYILPSRAGWALFFTLCVLLVASINYQMNLGYLLTFLLAGSAAASMGTGHANLRGLHLHLHLPERTFATAACRLRVQLDNPGRRLHLGVGLTLERNNAAAWVDVPPRGSSSAELSFVPPRRGLHAVPLLTVSTWFPLGIFRIWSLWRPAGRIHVFPCPEAHPPPLPASGAGGGRHLGQAHPGEELDGVRAWNRGDPMKLIVWKKAARVFASGSGQLVVRDRPLAQPGQLLWLDAGATRLADREASLCRLCAWVLEAERQGLPFGLRPPGGQEIAPGQGPAHATRCLQALAICP